MSDPFFLLLLSILIFLTSVLDITDFTTSNIRHCADISTTSLTCHLSHFSVSLIVAKKCLPSSSRLTVSPPRHFPPAVSSVVNLNRRRTRLPSPCSASSVSLWNILRNNIGKDLSKVAMPVQLNEPLNTLQRLCEELEYSELLDTANQTQDPYQRMVRGRENTHDKTACINLQREDGATITQTLMLPQRKL